MPAQFLKDAQSGANSKFGPRSFSLSLRDKEFASHGALQNDSVGSAVTGDNVSEAGTSNSPNATSTAPSTSGSTPFFSMSGNLKMRHQGLLSLHHRIESSGASSDNITLSRRIPFSMNNREEDKDDDDLQITEVRQISEEQSSQDEDTSFGNKTESTKTLDSSNDLVLEALFKSQKLCQSYKAQLSAKILKITSQDELISSQKSQIESLKSSFKKLKETLSTMEEASKELNQARKRDNSSINLVKADHRLLLEKIESFKLEVLNLKKKIDHLKQIRISTAYEVEQSMQINTFSSYLIIFR